MRKITVAITQMASTQSWAKNCDKAEALVREAAAQGASLVLLQELFDGDYFCIEQHVRFFAGAHELDRHPTVAALRAPWRGNSAWCFRSASSSAPGRRITTPR